MRRKHVSVLEIEVTAEDKLRRPYAAVQNALDKIREVLLSSKQTHVVTIDTK